LLNILVVEDEEKELSYCVKALKELGMGANMFPAASGETALRILADTEIDGAFIDIELPGINGFTLADRIRNMRAYHMLPIVFATGANKDVPETYKRYHNFDYIKKPFAAEEFRRISRRFFDEIQSQTETDRMDREKAVRVDDGGRATIVKAKDILYAKKEKRQTVLVLAGQEYRLSDCRLSKCHCFVSY
jgi:DNA-binding LytR/AlgR family response regulator